MSTVIQSKPDQLTRQQISQQALPGASVPWVTNLREAAFSQFESSGFPTSRIEDWKYTNLKALQKQTFRFPSQPDIKVTESDIGPAVIPDLDVYRVVFVDGLLDERLSQLQEIPSKIHVASLRDQLSTNDKDIEPHLAKYADPGLSGFVSLNTAFMRDGIHIHLPRNVVVDKPIHLIYVSTTQNDATWFHLRNLIVVEPSTQATLIETYVSLGDSVYFNNITTEVSLGENAKLAHYKIQQEATQAFHVFLLKIRQHQSSQFSSCSLAFGGKYSRNEIRSELSAPGCECILNGLYLADERQQVDTLARVDHLAANGISREFFKGIVTGKAKAIFRGIAYVHPNAQQSDAEQKNNNLLLSPDAEVDTKPQLEIYADDVKCSHGATVGQLDDDALFYLRSRGIEKETACGLLTYSFAKEITDGIPIAPLARHAELLLKNVLPGARYLEDLR